MTRELATEEEQARCGLILISRQVGAGRFRWRAELKGPRPVAAYGRTPEEAHADLSVLYHNLHEPEPFDEVAVRMAEHRPHPLVEAVRLALHADPSLDMKGEASPWVRQGRRKLYLPGRAAPVNLAEHFAHCMGIGHCPPPWPGLLYAMMRAMALPRAIVLRLITLDLWPADYRGAYLALKGAKDKVGKDKVAKDRASVARSRLLYYQQSGN